MMPVGHSNSWDLSHHILRQTPSHHVGGPPGPAALPDLGDLDPDCDDNLNSDCLFRLLSGDIVRYAANLLLLDSVNLLLTRKKLKFRRCFQGAKVKSQ
jgi:hypothetical protein